MANKPPEKILLRRARLEPEMAESGLEGDWPPKWMTTYSDITTLLMTFFVLWYAVTMMKIPEELLKIKDDEKDSLEIPGMMEEAPQHVSTSPMKQDIETWQKIENLTPEQRIAVSELRYLKEKLEEIKQNLEKGELEEKIKLKVIGEDLVVIPSAALLFSKGSARINHSFYPVLDKIGSIVKRIQGHIRIEGHSDNTPINPRHRWKFLDNWELSTARATAVGRYLIEHAHLSPGRIAVSGYGPTMPLYSNNTPRNQARNRRVEFHISVSSEGGPRKG